MIKPDGDMGEADESDLDEEYSKTGGVGMAKARVEPRTMKLLIFAFGTLALAEILAHGPFEKRQPTI